MASKAFKAAQATLSRKEADLDMMDDQLMGMDTLMEPEATSMEFDALAQKRNELEENIRKMRERIELISAWEQLKNGDWSEEVKGLLKDLDINIAEIADNAGGAAPMGMDPLAAPAAPIAPIAPGAPAAVEPPPAPMVTEAPAAEAPIEEAAPAPAPEGGEELPPPMASSKKSNYEVQVKKGNSAPSTLKKEGTMTQTATKPSLKPEILAAKAARENIARTRSAAAFSIAKTMLPGAPIEVHKAFATSLLQNSTKVLKAALRQTAANAYAAKLAEEIKRKHKMELNDLLEEPSVLSSAKREVESEVKGDAKNAAGKVADDRKDAGPQTETYNDGRGCGGGTHTEPKEMDGGHAGDRPADTVNKSEEADKTLKAAAAAKKAHGADCKGCAECKTGTAKKADDMPPMGDAGAPPAEGAAPEVPAADAGAPPAEAPAPEMGAPGAEAESTTVLTEEKKMDMKEDIDEAEQAIQHLLQAIEGENEAAEGGVAEMAEMPGGEGEAGTELKVEDIFNPEEMEDKEGSLANQDENSVMADGDSIESFFGPSASADLEASLEPQTASITDMFAVEGSDADPMAVLFGGKEAGDVAGMDVLPSFTSETAKHFESDTAKGDTRDAQSDHESDIWAEALESIGWEEQGAHRVKQDSTNELEEAPEAKKAAARPAKKAAYTGPIRPTSPKQASEVNVAEALMGSFFGDEPDSDRIGQR